MREIDKVKVSSLLLNCILIMLLLLAIIAIKAPCPEIIDYREIVIHDTIRPLDKPVIIATHKPVIKRSIVKSIIDTISLVNAPIKQPIALDTSNAINIYSDTFYQADNYHAIINDTVNGVILNRSFSFVNLKPEVITTKTITQILKKKEGIGVYIGSLISISNQKKYGIGVSAIVAIPKIIAVSYSYDGIRQIHNAGIYAPISFWNK